MQTIIDELMNESMKTASCTNGSCGCRHCTHQRNQEMQQIHQELESLELNLEEEEELELSRIFSRAKALLKKGVNKVMPAVRWAQILSKIITGGVGEPPPQLPPPPISAPAPPRDPVHPDIGRALQNQKQRKMERDVKPGRRKTPMVQKPDKESSLIQELLTEQGF